MCKKYTQRVFTYNKNTDQNFIASPFLIFLIVQVNKFQLLFLQLFEINYLHLLFKFLKISVLYM